MLHKQIGGQMKRKTNNNSFEPQLKQGNTEFHMFDEKSIKPVSDNAEVRTSDSNSQTFTPF